MRNSHRYAVYRSNLRNSISLTMATEGFDCSGEESCDVESSSDDSLVEEELTFMEGEVESRERVLVRKSVRFYKAIIATALYKVCWCS